MHPLRELKKAIFPLAITSLFFSPSNTHSQSTPIDTFQKPTYIIPSATNNVQQPKTNNLSSIKVKKIELSDPSIFSTDPALRPTARDKLLMNRLNESLGITLSSYSQFIYPLSPSINQQFYDNYDKNMWKAGQRGIEWTLRSAFFDPLAKKVEGYSLFDRFERKVFQDLSGWEDDTLPNPRDPLREGLPGVRKTYLPDKKFDAGIRLFRRNPYAHFDYSHENFSFSTRLSAGSLTKPDTFMNPKPHASLILQLPLTKEIPIDVSVETSRDSNFSTYIGTHYDFGKNDKGEKGSLIFGFSPSDKGGYLLYNLRF